MNATQDKTFRVCVYLREGYADEHPPVMYVEARNPMHAVSETVAMLKRKGLNPNHFDLKVNGTVKQS